MQEIIFILVWTVLTLPSCIRTTKFRVHWGRKEEWLNIHRYTIMHNNQNPWLKITYSFSRNTHPPTHFIALNALSAFFQDIPTKLQRYCYEPSEKHGFSLLGKLNCSIWVFLLCSCSWESSCPYRIFIICCIGGNVSFPSATHCVSEREGRSNEQNMPLHFIWQIQGTSGEAVQHFLFWQLSAILSAACAAAAVKTRTTCILGWFCVLVWGFFWLVCWLVGVLLSVFLTQAAMSFPSITDSILKHTCITRQTGTKIWVGREMGKSREDICIKEQFLPFWNIYHLLQIIKGDTSQSTRYM